MMMTKTETSQMNDDRMDHQSRQHIFSPMKGRPAQKVHA